MHFLFTFNDAVYIHHPEIVKQYEKSNKLVENLGIGMQQHANHTLSSAWYTFKITADYGKAKFLADFWSTKSQ